MTTAVFFQYLNYGLDTALLIAIAFSFAFKETIKKAIESKFQDQLNKSNEKYKHELQREMEAYKASIMRDMEEHKLQVDIRRNIALKIADGKLKAYQEVEAEVREFIIQTLTYGMVTVPQEMDLEEQKKVNELADELRMVMKKNSFFMPLTINSELKNLTRDCYKLFNERAHKGRPFSEQENKIFFTKFATLSNALLKDLLDQVAPPVK